MNYYIGCHLSGQDIFESIDEVNKYGGNMIQIFVSSPIGKQTKNILDKYIELGPKIKKYVSDRNSKIVIHSPYVLNFAKKFEQCLQKKHHSAKLLRSKVITKCNQR